MLKRFRAQATLACCAALLLLTVCSEPGGLTGPSGELSGGRASLSFVPTYPAGSASALRAASLDVDNVRIVIRRTDGTVALDTTVVFPPGVDAITLQANVVLHGATEQLAAQIQLRSGSVVLFEGTQQIDARAGVTSASPVAIATHYAGPGANATKITIAPRSIPLLAGATSQLTVAVTDANGAAISGVPLTWSSSDPTVAIVSDNGIVTALAKRGTSNITAKLLSGLSDAVASTVTLPPSSTKIVSGGAQTGRAGDALAQPLVVEVDAADGVGVQGVTVNFRSVTGSGSVSPASAVTDAGGRASATLTLGSQAGAQSFDAAAPPLAAISAAATATAAAASQLAIVSGNSQSDTVGKTLRLPFAVRVADRFNNPVSGQTVSWARVSGTGSVASATSTTEAGGQATMAYTLGAQPGAESVSATVAGTSATFAATAFSRPPTNIIARSAVTQQGAAGSAGSPLAVLVTNSLGEGVAGVTVTWSVTGTATVGSPTTTTAADGFAAVPLNFGPQVGTSTVTASFGGSGLVQFAITTTAGTATQLVIVAGNNQGAQAQTAVTIPPAVRLLDGNGNPVNGAVAFTVTAGGGTVTGSPATTDASGRAAAGSWTLGASGTQTLTASFNTLTAVFTANVTTGASTQLAVTTQPGTTVTNGQAIAPAPVVQLRDANGNAVAQAGVSISVALTSTSQTLSGPTIVNTDAQGRSTFSNLIVSGAAGNNALQFTSGTLTSAASNQFQVVASAATQLVLITGNNQTGVTGQPLGSPLVVEARDASNNPVQGANVTYTVLTGGGTPATQTTATQPNGRAQFTWTMGPPGAQTLKACVPSCTAQVNFGATSIPSGADAIWNGSVSTDWNTPGNWSPAAVPSNTSNVYIPAGTVRTPVLSSVVTVNDLSLQAGATLATNTQSMGVSGDLLASGATITGTGTISMTGSSKRLAGSVPALVIPFGSVTTSGPTTINGDVTLSGGTLDIGSATVTMARVLTLVSGSGARLKMNNAAASLTVVGNAYFNAADMGDGDLTAGVLEFRGNFESETQYYQTFRAAGTHLTRFNGTSRQTVYMYYGNDDTHSRFQNVEFSNPAGVQLNTEIIARGSVAVLGTTALIGARMDVGGALRTDAGTSLAGIADVVVYQGSTSFPQIAGVGPPQLYFGTGTVVAIAAGTTNFPGSIIVYAGTTIDIGSNLLVIGGGLRYENGSGARLRMNNGGGRLIVMGDAYFNAADMGDGDLTAGIIEFRGNFESETQFYQSFRAAGTHLTRFNGTTPQNIYMFYGNDDTHSRFQNVEFANPSGITLTSEVIARGTVSVSGTTAVGGHRLDVGGLLATASGTSLSGLQDVVVYQGSTSFPQLAGVAPPQLYFGTGTIVAIPSGTTTFPGSIIVYAGTTIDIGSNSLVIGGGLRYENSSSARLRMNNSAGRLIVMGNAYFNAADMGDGDLTAGTIEFRGDFESRAGYYQAFRATGTHLTRFNGSTRQTLYMSYGNDDTHSRFQDVEFSNPAGITLGTEIISRGTVAVTGTTAMTGARMDVGGLLTTASGTSLSALQDVVVYQGSTSFPQLAGVAPPQLYFGTGTVVTIPAGSTSFPGSIIVYAGTTIDIGANALTIGGGLRYEDGSSARLRMNNAAGRLIVMGNAYFNAADMGDGDLTAGTIEFRGDFEARANYYQAFRAAGTHLTRFNGSTRQSLYVSYGNDDTRSRFQNLEFSNPAGITLSTEIISRGTVAVTGTTSLTGGRMDVGGLLTTVSGTSLAGIQDVVIYQGSTSFPLISGAAPPTLYLGSGTTIPIAAGATTFPGTIEVYAGTTVDIGANTLTIGGGLRFADASESHLRMTDPAAHLIVNGNAYFNATDMGDADLTAGVLEFRGNFEAQSLRYQSFRATGSHLTKFNGSAAQSVYFSYADPTRSRFQNVQFANSSASGVTLNTGAVASGTGTQSGRLIVSPGALSISGLLSLGSTSNTNGSGGVTFGSCSAASGAVFTGFSCP